MKSEPAIHRLKRVKLYAALLVLLVVVVVCLRLLVFASYINPADAVGLTQSQCRDRFGEPDMIHIDSETGEPSWIYYHGIGLRGSALQFKAGQVDWVTHRER